MKESFELIILTKSAKYGGFCVAGIEPKSKQWRRLVTEDSETHGALTSKDMRDINGSAFDILDHIWVSNAEHQYGSLQTENYLIDRKYPFKKLKTTNIMTIAQMDYCSKNETVFLGEKHVMHGNIDMLGHSLELHHVSDLRIYSVKSGEKLKTKADFILNNKRHERFAVTDPGYYMPEGDVFQIKDAYVVFSISDDEWARTYGHYKYIAAIYDLDIQAEPVAVDKTSDENKLVSYWSEGDVDYADLFCDELPELWHEEYGKGTILTLDENLVQVRFDTGIRKLASNILLKGKRISFESKEIIRIKSELSQITQIGNGRISEAVEKIHQSTKDYLKFLEQDASKGKGRISGIVTEIEKNLLKIKADKKIPLPDAVEFEVNGICYDQNGLVVEDYDEDKQVLTIRALGQCAKIEWTVGQAIYIVSDLKFLIKNLNKWYGRYKNHITYPPVPTIRAGISYAKRTPSEEQQKAIVRSLNSPISYVWGAPGTGKTSYVLSNCIRYCIQTGRKVGLFAPTNHALDMALISIIGELEENGIEYKNSILRLGIATKHLQEKYPDVCEHRDQVKNAQKYNLLCEQIEKILKWRKTLNNASQIISTYPDFEKAIQLQLEYNAVIEKRNELQSCLDLCAKNKADAEASLANFKQIITNLKLSIKPGLGTLLKSISGKKRSIEKKIDFYSQEINKLHVVIAEHDAKYEKYFSDLKIVNASLKPVDQDICFKRIVALAGISKYMQEFVSELKYGDYRKKYEELKRTTDAAKTSARSKLADYPQYEDTTDEELIELQKEYRKQAVSSHGSRKNLSLIASTLDVYNARVGVAIQGERNSREFCMSFDHVFLDEAGYCSLPKALPLLAQGCPITMLGDHMQLAPISEAKPSNEKEQPNLLYWKNSALQIGNLFDNTLKLDETVLSSRLIRSDLTYSHRFSQELAKVLDSYVYKNGFCGISDNKLSIQCIDTGASLPDDDKNSSTPEAASSIQIAKEQSDNYVILTPYRNQIDLIRKMNWRLVAEEKVLTIHRSQGREWDTVIISLVDPFPGFFTDSTKEQGIRTINTAISRTKKKLIIVGNLSKWKSYSHQMISTLIKLNDINSPKPTNAGSYWSTEEEQKLKSFAASGMSIVQIAEEMKRTPGAISSRLRKMGL